MPGLFDPFSLKGVQLRNRIVVAPMCQYSAEDGVVTDWHRIHLGGLARGGSSLVFVEATAVSPEGRITVGCTGLWNDEQAAALAPIVDEIKRHGAAPGIQIAHAGRKGSTNRPWEGDDHFLPDDPRAWKIIAPSAQAAGGLLPCVPCAMTKQDIERVKGDFVSAAVRARDLGFECLMLHFAHGYLAQSFFSPYSNLRDDEYGGSFENRCRFLIETFEAVRAVWPEDRPLSMRLGVVEYDDQDEQKLSESIALIKRFRDGGLDLIDLSMGFTSEKSEIPWGPAFMAPVAARVRRETGMPTGVSWNITLPEQADALIRDEMIDLVLLGRPLLVDPHWPYAAARALGVEHPGFATLPIQYAHWVDRYRIA